MSSINDLRGAITDMVSYLREEEADDFIEQIENFELNDTKPSQHIFLAVFAAHNALLESEGEQADTLGYFLHQMLGTNGEWPKYFQCQNKMRCGYIGTVTDPIQDRLLLVLDYNEPMPAGVCPHCAALVRAV